MELNNITNTGTWGQQVTKLNDNFNKVALGIDTLQSAYQSLSQSAIEAVDTLPQTGEANKIYRLVGTTSYSDYMYNTDDLTTPILMATYNNAIDNTPTANSANLVTSGGVAEEFALGAVYDVSAKNPTAGSNNDGKWESISTLLSDANLNTLIPISVRKGGMSVKFVSSSDNKYVQYRLMSNEFTTDITQWAIADEDVYVENPEWIYVLLDSQKRILAGLKSDGSVEWSIGVPTPVKIYITNAIAEIKNGTEGTDLDGLNKIIDFLSEFSTSDTLKGLLDTKVDKKKGKSLIDEEYAEVVRSSESGEYLSVDIDLEDKIISGRKTNGILEERVGIITPSVNTDLLNFNSSDGIKNFVDSISSYLSNNSRNTDTDVLLLREYIKDNYPYYFNFKEFSSPDADTSLNSYEVESYIEKKISEVPKNGKHFIAFTDVHWISNSKKSIKLINYVKKRLGIKNVLFLGDVVQSVGNPNAKYKAAQNLSVFCEEFFGAFGTDGLYVQGNHDSNYQGYMNAVNASEDTTQIDPHDYQISDSQVFKRSVANQESVVMFDENGIQKLSMFSLTDAQYKEAVSWMKLHYHYDDTENKIRYIVLETGSNGPTQLDLFGCTWFYAITLQLDWVYETLLSTPDDYDIVVAGHQIGEKTGIYWYSLQRMLSLFKIKSSETIQKYVHSKDEHGNYLWPNAVAWVGSQYQNYNFSASTHKGKIYIINGHYHQDRVTVNQTVEGQYVSKDYAEVQNMSNNAILQIWIDRDNYCQPGTPLSEYSIPNIMTLDTVTENLFDVITIEDNKTTCTRFGAGENRIINY